MSSVPTPHSTEPLPVPPSHSGDPGLASAQPIVHVWRHGPTVVAVTSGLPAGAPAFHSLEQVTPMGAVEVVLAAQAVRRVEAPAPAPVLTLGADV